MSRDRLTPPPAPACLEKRYLSSQKGGTLIAEDVDDLETHLARLCDPDGYRPSTCQNCAHPVLHVHDYRDRLLLSDPKTRAIRVIRYLCARCRATWRILPSFVTRHLWRSWRVVEAHGLDQRPPPSWPKVPKRTRRRWRARINGSALFLVQIFLATRWASIAILAKGLSRDVTRKHLVTVYAAMLSLPKGRRIAALAALIHRLAPGARVM